jgi:cytochrome b
MSKILVWDLPTRMGHWLLAGCFAVAYLTGESEALRLVHVAAGLGMLALVAQRLVWGVAGSRYARFSSFIRAPSAVWRYLTGLVRARAEHWAGHNPAGGYMILVLLASTVLAAISGLGVYLEWGGDWLEEVHEALSGLMLAAVGMHVAGVVVASLLHRENLARAMMTGHKRGEPAEAIPGARAWAVVLPLGALAAGIWLAMQI